MTGYDCQAYENLKIKVASAGFKLELRGDTILIPSCGAFASVREALSYMCGYEHGVSRIKEPTND